MCTFFSPKNLNYVHVLWFCFQYGSPLLFFFVDFIIHLIVFKKKFHPRCCIHNIQCGIDYDAVEWLGVVRDI